MQQQKIKRALLSVSDKTGIVEFARELTKMNIEIISTGGTHHLLSEHNIPVKEVAEITQFPEIMDGRVKTLHPKIHGGILGKRDVHADIAKQNNIDWIDLVVVNLYPFEKTIQKQNVTWDEAIENIDVGGPTMIRAAAKNMEWVGIVIDPDDYEKIITEIKTTQALSKQTRRLLATKAFAHTAQYDDLIQSYLYHASESFQSVIPQNTTNYFPNELSISLKKSIELRYGENPHQKASAYFSENTSGILQSEQIQGKQLSYNNIVDSDAAMACLNEFTDSACVIVKHANPCGAALSHSIHEAFLSAFHADAQSAFGGIIALNRPCDKDIASFLEKVFIEVIIAPDFSKEALTIFSKKPNIRVLKLSYSKDQKTEYRFIQGGVLLQEKDHATLTKDDLKLVTEKTVDASDLSSLLFAWKVVKHIKSNAILLAKDQITIGVGAGQVSRVDSVDIAIKKAGEKIKGSVLASDAFFPFRDSIDHLSGYGIKAIIQPGGSVRDDEVIAACNEQGIAMVFTGIRCFKH